MNLAKLAKTALHDEAAAVDLMIQLRWPNGVACPRCGCLDPYRINRKGYAGHPPRRGLFKCSGCKKQFTVTTGTVFEASHISLSKWLMAIHLMSASKKGMSAHQLHRMLGITYKAAWFINHRLRFATLATDFVLDALEQAIYDRCGADTADLIHHSDRGTQYVSMRYTERLAEAQIAPSVGSRGDSYDNALAESVIGLFKTEVIRRQGPRPHREAVEYATLTWVDWFNTQRLLEPIGYVPPAEYEARYYAQATVA